MVWYFYQSQNKIQKKKGKIKQRKKEKLTSRLGRGPPLQPAQPTRTPLSSSTPRCQAARWRGADAVDATSTPRTFQAAPSLQSAPGRRPRLPLSLPPTAASSRASSSLFPFPPRSAAVRRRKNP